MGHAAGKEFFGEKKPWSPRKDEILAYYLEPYLSKIKTVGKPIVIVDAFAGPGRFEDASKGSPIVICEKVASYLSTNPPVGCRVICVEPEPDLYSRLLSNLAAYRFASCRPMSFLGFLPELEALASAASVFIYADPFAIKGLEWAAMDRVFRFVGAGQSVELLLNFNARAFVRRARAALELEQSVDDPEPESAADRSIRNLPAATLDSAVGGTWWRDIAKTGGSFAKEVDQIAQSLCLQLRSRFGEAGLYDIRERLTDSIPKYSLIFASRHPDALGLINDAVCSDREKEVGKIVARQRMMFEASPEDLPSEDAILRPAVLQGSWNGLTRRQLRAAVTRTHFGLFRQSAITREINRLHKTGSIRAESNQTRINDDTRLFRAEAVS